VARNAISSLNRRRELDCQSQKPWRLLLCLLLLSTVGGVFSCGGDSTTGPPRRSDAQTFWALRLNQRAVQLALVPGANTVQLSATPVNAAGAILSGLGTVHYTTSDSTVTVSPTGLVTAHFVTSLGGTTVVVASLQAQNVTLTDVVRIQVTDTVPQHLLATFSIQPAPNDSAKRSLDFSSRGPGGIPGFSWPVRATDAAGTTVCDTTACSLLVSYTSSNPTVATIDTAGAVTTMDTGRTVFTATTLAYGVALRDSVVFRVGYRLNVTVWIVLAAVLGVLTVVFHAPKVLILGVGATITFCSPNNTGGATSPITSLGIPVDVVFDHPEAIDSASTVSASFGQLITVPPSGSGNIAPFACDTDPDRNCLGDSNQVRSRRFPVAGTYHYHSSLFPSDTNTILIKKE
jgi:hypothetical protein